MSEPTKPWDIKQQQSVLRQERILKEQTEILKQIAIRLEALTAENTIAGQDGLPDDFDPALYLLLNRDVAAAGVDAGQHYLLHGMQEGRRYTASFAYAQDGLFTIHNSDFQKDPEFVRAYTRGLKATESKDYKWHWRVHVVLWAARSAVHLPGDFVECGVNRGFLSSAIMEDLNWNDLNKTFWLLDTFAGIDTSGISSEQSDPGSIERNQRHFESGLYTTDVESVRRNFAEWQNVEIVVGTVPGTLDRITSEQIAFASIDMNSAPPEVAAMEFLWPRLVPGAMVVLDDFTYKGYEAQNLALNKFARSNSVSILSLPTGQGLIVRPDQKRSND